MNDFFITYTGARVYPDSLEMLDINLEDIAHHLTKIQRYGGSLPLDASYSVAEHSILMAEYCLEDYSDISDMAPLCLLHDAAEAYLGDVVSGLKSYLPDYCSIEAELFGMIAKKYNLDLSYTKQVKELDTRILLDEVRGLLPWRWDMFKRIHEGVSPLGVEITGTSHPVVIKQRFLDLCAELGIED